MDQHGWKKQCHADQSKEDRFLKGNCVVLFSSHLCRGGLNYFLWENLFFCRCLYPMLRRAPILVARCLRHKNRGRYCFHPIGIVVLFGYLPRMCHHTSDSVGSTENRFDFWEDKPTFSNRAAASTSSCFSSNSLRMQVLSFSATAYSRMRKFCCVLSILGFQWW